MWMIPVWYAVMFAWGILVETRVFGELLPLVAVLGVLVAEEALAAAVDRRRLEEEESSQDHGRLMRAA
jgi:hypothetical protein